MTSFSSLLQLSDTLDLSSLVVAQGKHLSLLLSSGSLRGGGRSTTFVALCKVRERKELSMQSKFWLRKGIRLCRASSPLFVRASVVTRATWIVCVCFLLQSQTMSGKLQGLSLWGLGPILTTNVNSMTGTSSLELREIPNVLRPKMPPVVQRADSNIQWINRYSLGNATGFGGTG